MTHRDILRVGCAAGFSGDRTDAAAPVVAALAASGGPSVLIFETLAERTLALAQLARRSDPDGGYEPLLDELLRPVLGTCLEAGIRIVSNFGAANPAGAARRIAALARELGLRAPRIAVVSGDDLGDAAHRPLLRAALGRRSTSLRVVSANAYVGAEAIADALIAGCRHRRLRPGRRSVADGRSRARPLRLGPRRLGPAGARDDGRSPARMRRPGHRRLLRRPRLQGRSRHGPARLPDRRNRRRRPLRDHEAAPSTGGRIDAHTVKEQLLYEVHDPTAYLTPDVVADLSDARVTELGPDRVRLDGVRGHPRPAELKVNVCHENGWLAEGEISYAGARAEARARLAADVLRERLAGLGPLRVDLIGTHSLFADDAGTFAATQVDGGARDVRLRVALNHAERAAAERVGREVTALYTCGPAGGGGVRTALRPRLGTVSCMVPRAQVPTRFRFASAE